MIYQGLDNRTSCRLPEGVSIQIMPAGITVRSCAYLYDFFIRAVIIICFGLVFSFLGDAGTGLNLILYFVISWGYYIFFESRNGTTPGKKKFKLKVVQNNGLPTTLSHIIIRNLIRPADSFPFAYALGILTMTCNVQFKRIGDWAAGTIVIYSESILENELKIKTDSEENIQGIAPNFTLSTEDQKIVISYAEYCQFLSKARQIELANILKDVLDEEGEAASDKLKQIAHFYLGQSI